MITACCVSCRGRTASIRRLPIKRRVIKKQKEEPSMDEKNVVIPKGMENYYNDFHFAPAVKDGNRLYCSGVIGVGADGKASADPETQFTQAFELVKSVLAT